MLAVPVEETATTVVSRVAIDRPIILWMLVRPSTCSENTELTHRKAHKASSLRNELVQASSTLVMACLFPRGRRLGL